jgi:hypothetical protein
MSMTSHHHKIERSRTLNSVFMVTVELTSLSCDLAVELFSLWVALGSHPENLLIR